MISHECSCIFEFIKLVGKKKKMRGFVKHLIGFPNEFNKFNDAEVECKILFIIIKLLKSHLRSGLPK